jgi:hypothetical protein
MNTYRFHADHPFSIAAFFYFHYTSAAKKGLRVSHQSGGRSENYGGAVYLLTKGGGWVNSVSSLFSPSRLMGRLLQERFDEPFKGGQLFGRQKIGVSFIIQQKGPDTNDRPGQITGPFNASFNLIPPFADQVAQPAQIDFHG